jgi:hypothetical protein
LTAPTAAESQRDNYRFVPSTFDHMNRQIFDDHQGTADQLQHLVSELDDAAITERLLVHARMRRGSRFT